MATSRWRLILRKYLAENPEEKQPLAKRLGSSVRSLDRWIALNSKTTDPEPRVVPRLVSAVPGHEEEMRLSLESDYPNAFESASVDILSKIPSEFYARVAETRATAASNLNRTTNMSTVLRQIGNHMDPDEEEGLIVLFARCVSPLEPGGRITGLFVQPSGYGTERWQYRQIERSYIIGSGSLCASAIVRGDLALYPQDVLVDYGSYPIIHGNDLRSCAAFPILREGNVAGALFVGSRQEEFFTEVRRSLLRQYSYLFALALKDDEFYSVAQIDLQVMPSIEHQSEIFFRSQKFLEDMAKKYPDETIAQLEQRGRDIFHAYIREEIPDAK